MRVVAGTREAAEKIAAQRTANRLLAGDDPGEVELHEARRSVEEGRARLAAARTALAPSA